MAACLRRLCWRPRTATVWSLCPTFKVTSLILMCRGYKPEALMCSPCIQKIPKAKVKQSPCTLLQSRKRKSIQLDQHTVQIQGKKLIFNLCINVVLICQGYKPKALMCSPCIQKIPKAGTILSMDLKHLIRVMLYIKSKKNMYAIHTIMYHICIDE